MFRKGGVNSKTNAKPCMKSDMMGFGSASSFCIGGKGMWLCVMTRSHLTKIVKINGLRLHFHVVEERISMKASESNIVFDPALSVKPAILIYPIYDA